MKKVLLIVVGLLITVFSYSQSFNRIIKATKSQYTDNKWVEIESQEPKDAFLIMKDWDITIGTTKYRTYDESEKTTYEEHEAYTWKCVDANGTKCYFIIKRFKPSVTLHMMYVIIYEEAGVMYEYVTE